MSLKDKETNFGEMDDYPGPYGFETKDVQEAVSKFLTFARNEGFSDNSIGAGSCDLYLLEEKIKEIFGDFDED